MMTRPWSVGLAHWTISHLPLLGLRGHRHLWLAGSASGGLRGGRLCPTLGVEPARPFADETRPIVAGGHLDAVLQRPGLFSLGLHLDRDLLAGLDSGDRLEDHL